MRQIADNLAAVTVRIGEAARRTGRYPASIKLVAVSKTKTVQEIAEAVEAGQLCFGENYAQELRDKHNQLKAMDDKRRTWDEIEWHFIGHLQKNKAKIVAPIVSWIESIDSLDLAAALDRHAIHPINCLIEVNIGSEDTKSGVLVTEVPNLARGLSDFRNLKLKGLMIIPPFTSDPEGNRPYFKKLKEILLEINNSKIYPEPLADLSMGMSHDFEVAIEEGATIIRVGTAIFGERR